MMGLVAIHSVLPVSRGPILGQQSLYHRLFEIQTVQICRTNVSIYLKKIDIIPEITCLSELRLYTIIKNVTFHLDQMVPFSV